MLLVARGLSYARPTAEGSAPVFSGLEIELESGTLALARLLPDVTAEALELDGRSAAAVKPEEWRAAVALLPQKPALAAGTVLDNLLLPWTFQVRGGSAPPDAKDLRAALDSVGLEDVELDRPAARLSAGQVSRVALLRILATRPRVMLLDEPDAALDDDSAELVGSHVRRFVAEGGAVVRVRHLRVDAAADRCLRLADGRLTEVAS
jgi:putative ABC transport system ATP-binding protein